MQKIEIKALNLSGIEKKGNWKRFICNIRKHHNYIFEDNGFGTCTLCGQVYKKPEFVRLLDDNKEAIYKMIKKGIELNTNGLRNTIRNV